MQLGQIGDLSELIESGEGLLHDRNEIRLMLGSRNRGGI